MNTSLKIAVSGAAGCGKTTMLKALQESEYIQSLNAEEPIEFIPEVVRHLKAQYGFKINEHGTWETEMMVMTTHLQNLIARKRFISDRCLVDNFIYSTCSDNPPPWWYRLWNQKMVRTMVGKYDLIFFIPNEFMPPDDGVRNLDPFYWGMTKARFIEEYSILRKMYPEVIVTISGTIPERVAKMEEAIRQTLERKAHEGASQS